MTQRSGFLQGLTTGALFTLLVGLVVIQGARPGSNLAAGMPALDQVLNWVQANLGLSLPVFGLLLVLYLRGLRQLKGAVARNAAIEQVAQADQMVDTWTSLFFGVGVIWTAIGMRSALVYALGEPELTLKLGAYAILERMVEGGILLALSTTIFGGIGGYVLRVVKALSVETELKRYYDRLAHAPALEMQATLRAIEAQLQRLAPQTLQEETEHGETGVVCRAAPRSGHR
jgi:hypothetical protein